MIEFMAAYSLFLIVMLTSMALANMFTGRYEEASGFLIVPTIILTVDVIGWFSWNHFFSLICYIVAILLLASLGFCRDMKIK